MLIDSPTYHAALISGSHSESPKTRLLCVKKLSGSHDVEAIDALCDLLFTDKVTQVREESFKSLTNESNPLALKHYSEAVMQHGSTSDLFIMIEKLNGLPYSWALEALFKLSVKTEDKALSGEAYKAFLSSLSGVKDDGKLMEYACRKLRSAWNSADIIKDIFKILEKHNTNTSIRLICELGFKDARPLVRDAAISAARNSDLCYIKIWLATVAVASENKLYRNAAEDALSIIPQEDSLGTGEKTSLLKKMLSFFR